MDDMDRQIAALAAEGFSDRQIAREVGLSRTAVRKRRAKLPAAEEPDTDPDPWANGDDEAALGLYDDDVTGERWPVPPFVYCGTERVWLRGVKGEEGHWADNERWLDAGGRSLSVLDLYRFRMRVANELEDRERADRIAADMARQVAEHEARA